MKIEACESADQPGWLRLRQALWPDASREAHLAEMTRLASDRRRYANFIGYSRSSEAVGLAEASIRHDYVNGTDSSPVAFLEGLYVAPQARRQRVAAALVAAVADWARGCGCRELASDAAPENSISHVVHLALGFEETERVVFFRRKLA